MPKTYKDLMKSTGKALKTKGPKPPVGTGGKKPLSRDAKEFIVALLEEGSNALLTGPSTESDEATDAVILEAYEAINSWLKSSGIRFSLNYIA